MRTTRRNSTSPPIWSQIAHNGLDDYSDPKVRQGITPKVARTPGRRRPRNNRDPERITADERSGIPDAAAPQPRAAPGSTGWSQSTMRTTQSGQPHSACVGGLADHGGGRDPLPFRPALVARPVRTLYAIMWAGHFVFEGNLPTIFRHPTTPFVIAWAVIRNLGRGIDPPGFPRAKSSTIFVVPIGFRALPGTIKVSS